ncbi:MAG: 16S rRNA (cytidine(1402)-2'-O)-methyltransferase [Chloroflexi bacterium]|nr:16S rRNA (cytidine(1402)-2'-O)-methyltransferase [Chloroflexota bacterium]
MGTLYVVATPIGNLEDLSPRAARILREVTVVACEDTRETRKLLNAIGAKTPTLAFHEFSPPEVDQRMVQRLEQGDVAYVTDVGTPGVSDPGVRLVRAAAEAGHGVVSVPGPSALTAALSVSGLPADSFLFLGFLPRKPQERSKLLATAADLPLTLVAFEAPHRLQEALHDIRETLGDRSISVSRELSKLYEETFRGKVSEAIAHFTAPRGEFVLVIEGVLPGERATTDDEISQAIKRLRATGLSGRSLVDAAVEATGAPRSRVYRLALRVREET